VAESTRRTYKSCSVRTPENINNRLFKWIFYYRKIEGKLSFFYKKTGKFSKETVYFLENFQRNFTWTKLKIKKKTVRVGTSWSLFLRILKKLIKI